MSITSNGRSMNLSTVPSLSKYLKQILVDKLSFANVELISCPQYIVFTKDASVDNICFTSTTDSDKLFSSVGDVLDDFTDVTMAWRKDMGIWTAHYGVRNHTTGMSVSIYSPGTNEDMRNDSKMKRFGAVVQIFINDEPKS